MLTSIAIEYLSPLEYRADAERTSCILPLCGIYWSDEIPDFRQLLRVPEEDRKLIFRLFAIRFRMWREEDLSEADQQFWDEARSQVPRYGLFQRLDLSDDDRQAQAAVERELVAGLEVLFADAKEITVTTDENGLSSFSATLDLTKEE